MSWRDLVKMVVPRPILRSGVNAVGLASMNLNTMERFNLEFFLNQALLALRFNGIDGDYLEFGCHKGFTFCTAYHIIKKHNMNCKMWGFDSFAGLPEPNGRADEHPRWKAGSMSTSIEAFQSILRENHVPQESYSVVQGFYEQTIARMGPTEEPTNICMANIDCVMYSSTKTVLQFLKPRLKHGMIIAFDDYYCWSADQLAGERRAMLEEFDDDPHWVLAPYIQYGWHGASFIVESRQLHRKRADWFGETDQILEVRRCDP